MHWIYTTVFQLRIYHNNNATKFSQENNHVWVNLFEILIEYDEEQEVPLLSISN